MGVRAKSGEWEEGDVELGPVDPRACPPPRGWSQAGKTKYPFAEMEVHQLMFVRREKSVVRGAARRYSELHKGVKFSVWKGTDGRTVVKRVR